MPVKDAIDLLFAARERVDFYWNFYVIVVIAVIGWLVTRKEPLARAGQALVTIAYLIAATTNLVGLFGAYSLAEALRSDVLRLTSASGLVDTREVLSQHSYDSQRVAASLVHLGVGVTIVIVVWFGNGNLVRAGGATQKRPDSG